MSRTVVIRVGPVEQARREFKEDVATLARAGRVRHRREIWFANLTAAAKILTEQRLALLRLICQQPPRSTADLARVARRSLKAVATDVRVLERVGLIELVGAGLNQRPVAAYDRIHLAGDIALARAAA